jgi:hypothetical protein
LNNIMAPPLSLLLLLLLASAAGLPAAAQQQPPPIARPGCRDKCGNISIPYPFGIGPGCFIAEQFQVLCDDFANPPRAFLVNTSRTYQQNVQATLVPGVTKYPFVFAYDAVPPSPIELMDISIPRGEVRAYGAVSSYCTKSSTYISGNQAATYICDAWQDHPLAVHDVDGAQCSHRGRRYR